MEDQLLDLILQETYTLPQLFRRVALLRKYLSARLFKGDMKLEEISVKEDYVWLNNLDPSVFTHFNQENHGEIIDNMVKKIDSLKTLIIYMPFELPDNQIPIIGKNLRASYGQNLLFESRLDPSLLGGCALVWNGVYKDYSLKARINNNKQKVIESFKSFIK